MFSIGIVGVGNIGSTLVHLLCQNPAFSLFLYDKNTKPTQGRVLDLRQAHLGAPHAPCLTVVDSVQALASCDLIVMTAGKTRQPGMDRQELLSTNQTLIRDVALHLRGSTAHILIVTNPVDIMAAQFFHTSQWPAERVIAMAGLLDSLRLQYALGQHFDCASCDIEGMVIGPHNDAMLPVKSSVRIQGQPLDPNFPKDHWQKIVQRTQQGGKEIVELLGTGSAFYAPAHCLKMMIESIAFDQKRLFSCGTLAQGHYGLEDMFISLPVILGRKGVEKVCPLALDDQEHEALCKGARALSNIKLL